MDNHHIIPVTYSGSGSYRTRAVYQYDYGQILSFDGFDLPDAFEVHFHTGGGESVTVIGHDDQVAIPDSLLQIQRTVTAWLFLHDTEDDGETRFVVEIPVRGRSAITDEEPTPVEQSAITQAIAALQTAVTKTEAAQDAAETAADEAEAAADSLKGATAGAVTLPEGSAATAELSVNEGVFAFGFGIPVGATGPQGPQGIQGDRGEKGETGATPDMSIGTVQTLPAGSQATAQISGTAEQPVLSLGIPKGDPGSVPIDDTAGVGDTTKVWSADKTAGEVSDLKSATDSLEQRVTALDGGNVDLSFDIIENSYVANTNGTIYNYNGWNRTSYISLTDVSKLIINIPQSTVYNYYYKADKSPLENGNLRLNAGINEVTIPEGAAYLICSGAAASLNAITVENGAETVEDAVAEIEIYKRGNLINFEEMEVGYIDSAGATHQSNNIWCTYFCELSGDKVYSHGLVITKYFAFYDENRAKIATWEDTGGMKYYTEGTLYYLDIPAGAKYFRATTTNNPATDKTIWISNEPETPNNFAEENVSNAFPHTINPTNPCDYSELTVRAFSRVVCIGDSLTYGGFNLSDSGTPTGETQSSAELSQRYSYPSNFERITGIETINAGDSGETSVSWYAAHQNDDFSQYDLAIIFLGVNDSAFNVSDADTLTAMQNIIAMLNNARSDMRIAICSCIPAYGSTGYQAKGQLILNWAKSLNNSNIIPLDLAQYSHVKPRTSYVAGHCSALGYYMMALDIARYISWYIDQHKRDFRFIQFIGSPDAEWSYD